jgi:hypothetical protein
MDQAVEELAVSAVEREIADRLDDEKAMARAEANLRLLYPTFLILSQRRCEYY